MAGFKDHCSACGQDLGYGLPRCQGCQKSVCDSCAVRMGGSLFCGKPCAFAFLFGGQEDVEDESDLGRIEDVE